VKVPEGKGVLGAHAPFVVLLQGKCHISYNEASLTLTHRRQLGSMKLLASGARIADLLTFHSHHSKSKDASLDELIGGGKWVPGPDVVHCHDEIAYHFARDSLVFIPSEQSLAWLPAKYSDSLSTPQTANGDSPALRVATATGSPAYSLDKRSGSPVAVSSGDAENLAA